MSVDPEEFVRKVRIEVIEAIYPDPDNRPTEIIQELSEYDKEQQKERRQ